MTEEPRILGGRYQLGETLGRGGMAEVRKARDLRLGREVAIKQLRIDLASDPTFQERFRREAQAAAGLNHPNIVAVYDTGEEPDPITRIKVPYIVMELVEGHTLRDLLRTGRKIQPEKALVFAKGTLDALAYSHKAGIVHRDIKPANVMLTSDGEIKVMDFGIARAVADTSATMTQTAAVIGTAQYLSPEQARGETVDARSDIYSAGCLLYELLTGRPPFQGDSPVSVAYQHVRETPVPPGQLDSMITPAMDSIVLKALAKDPADRYQTASDMSADISRLLAGQDIMAQPLPATMVATAVGMPAATEATALLRTASPVHPGPLETDPDEEKPERKRRIGLIAFLVALAVVAAGTGIFLAWHAAVGGESATVPSVLYRSPSEATQLLTDAHLVAKVVSFTGPDDGTRNQVINQDPKPNAQVPINTEVTITVNTGPNKATIPFGLKGQKADSVVSQLHKLGFKNVTKSVDPNEDVSAKSDDVTSITPAEGSTLAVDTPITVFYATGKSPVPNFRGYDQAQAEQAASEAGFTVAFKQQANPSQTPGVVFKQDPSAGTQLSRSKVITLWIATPATPPPSDPTP